MRLFAVIIFLAALVASSCQRGGHPCPTLSTNPSEANKNALIKKSVPTTKNGLVKKKGVKKVKRR